MNEIKDELKPRRRSTGVSNEIKLATTLRFLAGGGYQHGTGEEVMLSLAQQTVSDVISEVCRAIENRICPKIISFISDEEQKIAKQWFFEKNGLPGIIGH